MPATRRPRVVAAAGVAVGLMLPLATPAGAACPDSSRDADEAPVAFVGVALDGPAEPELGRLLTPAGFQVERWERGEDLVAHEGGVVSVETGVSVADGLLRFTTDGITPRAGERWDIVGTVEAGVIHTSTCEGSERLDADGLRPAVAADIEVPEPEPEGPGDGRALSLGVAGAGAVAIAVVLSRRWA